MKVSYKDAGVDVNRGQEAVKRMKKSVQETFNAQVLTELGGFGGLFQLPKMNEPVLVSGTDGVGTKLLYCQKTDTLDHIGQDLVAMCVNDIICHGATPLFFLDYLALSHLDPERVAGLVHSVSKACKETGMVLIGGETAEMPGLYDGDEFDMAGFAVGVVEKEEIISGKDIKEGDQLIGLTSSGVHSNGYSLIRKLFFELYPEALEEFKEALAEPTRLYPKAILGLNKLGLLKGVCHITGGGFFENIPRMLPEGLNFSIRKDAWPETKLYKKIRELSGLDDEELFSTFNMGIGMVFCVEKEQVEKSLKELEKLGYEAYHLGEVKALEEGELL